MERKTKTCDFCDAEIFFGKNANDRTVPLEAKPLALWIENTVTGKYYRAVGYRNHYETCPRAEEARERAKGKPKSEGG